MTERFSPEYIKYILSNEASVLQEQWEPRVLDLALSHDKIGIVTRMYTATESAPCELNLWWADAPAYVEQSDVIWLPTLSDLLGMIEEAAIVDTGIHYDPALDEWYAIRGGHIVASEKDKELAAAKLAVRVVEEGKRGSE